MNSPLGERKVRLRELGGQALCGVLRTCASATGSYWIRLAMGMIRGNDLVAARPLALPTADGSDFVGWAGCA